MTAITTAKTCPSWCTETDHDAWYDDIPFHTGELTAGTYTSVGLWLYDEPTAVMTVTCNAGSHPQQVANDMWHLSADPDVLRGMARELLRAADAVERAL